MNILKQPQKLGFDLNYDEDEKFVLYYNPGNSCL